jgi:hypothetical protein
MPNQHTGEQYSKQDCIDALQEASDILRHSPTIDEYRSLDISPGTGTIVDRFGSWNNAKDDANLDTYFEREGPPDVLNMSDDEWWSLSRSQRYRLKKRAKVAEYKLSNGCHICGYDDHPHALDFHHLEKFDKEFNIGYETPFTNFEELKREMAKCEVICTNCHRELESKFDWG